MELGKVRNLRLEPPTFPVFSSSPRAELIATSPFRPKRSGLHKIVADRKADQLTETCETHFAHDVIPVAFDRSR